MDKFTRLMGYGRDVAQGASNSIASNVSAPVDGLSWLLRKAGAPVPANPMGGSDWMAQQGLTREPENRLAGLIGEGLGSAAPFVVSSKAPQIAGGLLKMGENAMAPQNLNKQAGMIKTPFGKIPETSKEIDAMAEYLRSRGEALGHNVQTNASNVSNSRYVTFKQGDDLQDLQIRLSSHGDRYPNQLAGTGERFTVDPASQNTLEMAKQWLQNNGVNLSERVKKTPFAGTVQANVQPELFSELVNGKWVQKPVKFEVVNGKMTMIYLD